VGFTGTFLYYLTGRWKRKVLVRPGAGGPGTPPVAGPVVSPPLPRKA